MFFEKNKSRNKMDNPGDDTYGLQRRLSAVLEVNHRIAGVVDLSDVLELVTEKLISLLGVSYAVIWLYDENSNSLRLAHLNVPKAVSLIIEKFLGNSISDTSYDLGNPSHLKNITVKTFVEGKLSQTSDLLDAGYPLIGRSSSNVLQTALRIKFVLHVPLIAGGRKLGVLGLIWNTPDLSESDKELVSTFSDQISAAIYNSKLFDKVQSQVQLLIQQNRDLGSLYNLTSNIMKSLDPDIVAQASVDSLPQDGDMIGAILAAYDSKNNEIYVKAFTQNSTSDKVKRILGDISQFRIRIDDPSFSENIAVKAYKFGNLYVSKSISDLISPPVPKELLPELTDLLRVKFILTQPISIRGRVIGTISYLFRNKSFDELSDNEKKLYETYTYQIAIALENADLLQNIEKAKFQIEEAYNKERDMMDILGHELRTPLTVARNAILMMDTELQKSDPNMATIKDYIEKSKENIRREIKTLQTVLSTTRLENNRSQINFEKVDLRDVVNDSLEAFGTEAKKKGLDVQVVVPADGTLDVWGGREQVQEIMDNLLSNAVKYTAKGRIRVMVERDEEFLKMSVADTGEGIPEEEVKNLGKKFHRVNPYVDTHSDGANLSVVRPGGTGIGLYVVTGFLNAMGGRLEVQSELGKGSNFIAVMPVYNGQDSLRKQIQQTVSQN